MALKIDITKEDTLIPSQAFQEWADKILTDEGIRTSGKNFFTKLGTRSEDLQKRLADLKEKIDACPAGSDVWFNKMFLWPFGGTVTADAKEYFEELEKDGKIRDLETAATAAAADRQTKGTQLTAACAAALAFFDGESSLLAAVGELSVALTTTAPPQQAPPGGGGTLARLKAKLVADPSLFALFTPPLQAGNIPNMRGDKILTAINAALQIPASKTKLDPVLTAAGYDPAAMPTTLREKLEYFGMSELVESGKITLEDYNRLSKRLSRTSSIINEAPAPAPADAAELATRKAQFDGFASSIVANGEAIIAELKGLQSLGQKLSTVTESIHRKVMKAHIKKRLLQETASRDSREQLNEFFLFAALLAALTGALAWAAAKVAEFFKGSEYGHGRATYSPRTHADKVADGLQTLGASMNAGYGPDGVLVGPDGKKVAGKVENKQATINRMDDCVTNIQNAMLQYQSIFMEAAKSVPVTAPVEPEVAFATYLGVTGTDSSKIDAVKTALTNLRPYGTPTTVIKTAVGNVTAALKAA